MRIRKILESGRPMLGTWLQSGSPVAAEIMAAEGFDFIAADLEHTDMNEDILSHCIRALPESCVPMVRVRENDTLAIRRALDCGAEGIIVPLINSAEEASRAVAAAKYPPDGVRGFAFCRANGWGKDFDAYARTANRNIAVFVMIESKEAVDHIDEILTVPGVDGVFIGPYDMSGSYGILGQMGHPVLQEAKQRVLKACLNQNRIAGQHIVIPTADCIQEALQEGYRFLALGMDTVFLRAGAAEAISKTKIQGGNV